MIVRVLFTIFAITLSAAQSASSGPGGTFRVAGTVVHGLTGQPLGQIHLSITRAQTSDVLQVMTSDDGGHFSFPVPAPGKYALTAQGKGFPAQALDEHQGFSTAVVAGPGKDSQNIVFRLRPESSISGAVTDEASEPVRDAQVMLFHRSSEEGNPSIHMLSQTSTDDQGHYHFPHLFPGTFFIAVAAHPWYAQTSLQSGGKEVSVLDLTYPVTYFPGTTDSKSATSIVISPGEKINADVPVAAVPALRLDVSGIMKSDGSIGLSATQKVFGDFSIPAFNQTESHGDGRAFMSGLAPGEIEIDAITPGNPRNNWKQTLNLSASGALKPPARNSSAVVSGKIILGEAKFRAAWVSLTGQSTQERIQAVVSPDGSFQFSDTPVTAGTYQIGVHNLTGAILANVVASGARVDGRTLEIGESVAVKLTLLMSKGAGQIDGTALRNGKPSPAAMIILAPENMEKDQFMIRRDQSDSDGTFTLRQVVPGRYTLMAIQNGWNLEWKNPAILKPYLKAGELVLVGPNHRYATQINAQ